VGIFEPTLFTYAIANALSIAACAMSGIVGPDLFDDRDQVARWFPVGPSRQELHAKMASASGCPLFRADSETFAREALGFIGVARDEAHGRPQHQERPVQHRLVESLDEAIA